MKNKVRLSLTEEEIKSFSNTYLLSSLEIFLDVERKASHIVLLHLKEIKERVLYAERGYPNLYQMLVKHFKLSQTSAYQRVKALEIMSAVPQETEEALKKGELNLTTLAMTQRQIQREEKFTGQRVSRHEKAKIVEAIRNKTEDQVEVELFKLLPNCASTPETHERRVSETETRLSLTIKDDLRKKLLRLQELWAHINPNMDYPELIERAVDMALNEVDPILRSRKRGHKHKKDTQSVPHTVAGSAVFGTQNLEHSQVNVQKTADEKNKIDQDKTAMPRPSSEESRVDHAKASATIYTPNNEKTSSDQPLQTSQSPERHPRKTYYTIEEDHALYERAQNQCEFIDPLTGNRCTSKHLLQKDHIIPIAKGGTNDLENLRLLCHTHNQLKARHHFGEKFMKEKSQSFH